MNPKIINNIVTPKPAKIEYGEFQKLGGSTITNTPIINPKNGALMLCGISLHAFLKKKVFACVFL
jgi:hypothetical protein